MSRRGATRKVSVLRPVRMTRVRAARAHIPLLAIILLALACASPRKANRTMLSYMQAGDYSGAIAVLDLEKDRAYGRKNEFLYHLERGMLLHYAGQWAKSNQSFAAATRLSDELYTLRISGELATWMTNDNARPYYGQSFERALVHMFAALNYEQLEQFDEALVEIRQLNYLLRKLVVDGEKESHDGNGFAHYLAGTFFSEREEHDEAFVSFKKALDAYARYPARYGVETPPSLLRDAARTAEVLGAWAVAELEAKYGQFDTPAATRGAGEIIVVHYNGRAPVKIDVFIDVAFGHGWAYVNQLEVEEADDAQVAQAAGIALSIAATESVRVAFPEYRRVGKAIRSMSASLDGGAAVGAELVEDIGSIAVAGLEDDAAGIRTKAIARAVVKYALSKGAAEAVRKIEGNYGELLTVALQVTSAVVRGATEVADKRAWFSVPEEIWLARMEAPPGDHRVDLAYRDQQGAVVSKERIRVTVHEGRRSFVLVRTLR